MKSSVKYIQDFKSQIVWERWNSNNRTDKSNWEYDFVKFKDNPNKICIVKIKDLIDINKTVLDIEWIAKIPEEFKIFIFDKEMMNVLN